MRILLKLLMFAWVIWLMYRLLKSPQRYNRTTTQGRKHVDSTIIEKDDNNSDK
jgi:hypothetical protein